MIINLLKIGFNQLLLKQLRATLVAFLLITLPFVFAVEAQANDIEQTIVDKSSTVNSNDLVQSMLKNMQRAVLKDDYQLYFVEQESTDTSDTLRYRHVYSDKENYAQLLYLDGASKEIVLYNNATSYFLPEIVSFSLPSKQIIEAFPDVITANFNELSNYYDFILLGKARSADRNCQLIRIVPKNKDRYNYVIWVDEVSHLPLRIDLLDLDYNVIKQIKVLSVDEHFDKQAFKHDLETRNYPVLFPADKKETDENSKWRVDYLPTGFKERVTYNVNYDQSDIDTRLYSDGIFSFTINISESTTADKSPHTVIQGINTIYSANINNMDVVIIGNIPLETIKKIANSIKRQ